MKQQQQQQHSIQQFYFFIYLNYETIHTSCSSNIESKVSFEEVIKSSYAPLTVSSDSQNDSFIDSCKTLTMFGHDNSMDKILNLIESQKWGRKIPGVAYLNLRMASEVRI